jgi:hypothetical protein
MSTETPKNIDEVIQRIMQTPDGYRKIAASMINPIREKLKFYGKTLSKEQEVLIEVFCKELCAKPFNYRDAIILQDKLVNDFRK